MCHTHIGYLTSKGVHSMFKGKNVLIAGGTGMTGRMLSQLLIEQGANLRITSLDDQSRAHPKAKDFLRRDLTNFDNCLEVCRDMDYVFNLLCTKGSPETLKNKPATIMRPMTLFNLHLFDAARQLGIKGFLYTSSVGVYYPDALMQEDSTETGPPSPTDFAGRTKLYGEWYAMALTREYNFNVDIVRPANIYGPYDNFDSSNSSVIPSLIKRALTEDPFIVWGNGSPVRDFIHAEDVARGILLVAEKNPRQPINIGSGVGVTIKSLVEIIVSYLDKKPKVVWDNTKPNGDAQRLLDISRAQILGFKQTISLREGIMSTIEWYKKNKDITAKRYDIFDTDTG